MSPNMFKFLVASVAAVLGVAVQYHVMPAGVEAAAVSLITLVAGLVPPVRK